jgi:LuxR family maltose regulon positive regulatory protein
MLMPLISTKIRLPGVPQAYLPRPKLITRLDAALGARLILVSAPAGFGKTALLAEWADLCQKENLVSWVHLDGGDNEVTRFLSYVIASLQTHMEEFGEGALSGLLSAPPAPIEAVLTSLVNEMDGLDRNLVLVLDDYHLIEAPEIHAAVSFLVEHAPSQFCLVLATRADPPLPLHRLRAQGELAELRTRDLRFSSQDTRNYLVNALGSSLDEQDLSALEDRIEGWIAGLQMVALSLRDRQDVHGFVLSFSGSQRFIMDYLTEEIYNQQPPPIQEFLLKTSILDRLSGPLCDFILENGHRRQEEGEKLPSAQQTLEYLEQANLFLLSLDDERYWYRYHQLFADLLQQRLRQTWLEQIPDLKARACNWFAANGYIDEALDYAFSAEDFMSAAQLVEEHGMELLKRGSLATLSGWLNRLP